MTSAGDPEPKVTWHRNGKKMKTRKSDKRVKVNWDMDRDLYVLEILKVTQEDAGEYTVEAESENGKTIITVTIKISSKIEIKKTRRAKFELKPQPATIVAGETLRLTCKVKGQLSMYYLLYTLLHSCLALENYKRFTI